MTRSQSTVLTPRAIDDLARKLDDAYLKHREIESLSATTEFTVDDAYTIQAALIGRREARGERMVGVKLGFTSKAKMAQMGISEVIVGRLTNGMRIADGGDLDLRRFIHPKAEPEIAFRLAEDFDPHDPVADIVDAVGAVAPAIEIIDSRFEDFRFTYTDVVADNTSAAGFVIGPWRSMTDISNKAVRLRVGSADAIGSTAAILGDPVRALYALAEVCRSRDIALRSGHVILAGAATAAVPVDGEFVECDVAGLGGVRVGVIGS